MALLWPLYIPVPPTRLFLLTTHEFTILFWLLVLRISIETYYRLGNFIELEQRIWMGWMRWIRPRRLLQVLPTYSEYNTSLPSSWSWIEGHCFWKSWWRDEEWSRDGLCFAARVDWRKVNTRFIPDAFQTLRFFCSGQDIKAIKAVWNTINQNSFSHPILVSRLLLRIGVAMTVFKVTSDLNKAIIARS